MRASPTCVGRRGEGPAAADTGWAPLFLAASAVVTELGGPLSHAAIILREYAVPAVVNVSGATRSLRDGDLVRVDGDKGSVEILGGGSVLPSAE